MRSMQSIIFFVVINNIGYLFLFIEASLVNSIFGKIRLNNIKLAHMPFAMAITADTIVSIMMIKVVTE